MEVFNTVFESDDFTFVPNFKIENDTFNSKFESTNSHLNVKFDNYQTINVAEAPERYEGDYNVIPKVISQTMSTANKFLSKNVKVESIPFWEVTNQEQGTTIIIGGENI